MKQRISTSKDARSRAPASLSAVSQTKKNRSSAVAPVIDSSPRQTAQGAFVSQLQGPEEEEPLQGKFTAQREEGPEEEEPLQGKFTAQREEGPEEEKPLQGKFTAQREEGPATSDTGIPREVQTKMETSMGADFSDVKVHPNSSKAPEVGALAYTQGNDVHFAPGQFKPETGAGRQLIGHELAHVVQQRQGRVQPTTEVGGLPVNDNPSLENEADAVGKKASE